MIIHSQVLKVDTWTSRQFHHQEVLYSIYDMSDAPDLFTVNSTGDVCTLWVLDPVSNEIENMPLHVSPLLLDYPQLAVLNTSYYNAHVQERSSIHDLDLRSDYRSNDW